LDISRREGKPTARPPAKGDDKPPVVKKRRVFSLSHVGEGLVLLIALAPVFLIGAVAGSKSLWTNWLEKIGVRESWGNETSHVPPAAVWQGDGVADFGQIAVYTYDPASGLVRSTCFRLHAVMAFSDQHEFENFIRRTGYVIRDEILVTVRASPLSEVLDPDFLSRKITARVNRILGADTVRSVQISDLNVTEYTPADTRK